jgi:hypothetical protein
MPYLLRVVLDMKQLGDNQINIHFIECYSHVSKFLKCSICCNLATLCGIYVLNYF